MPSDKRTEALDSASCIKLLPFSNFHVLAFDHTNVVEFMASGREGVKDGNEHICPDRSLLLALRADADL